MTRVNINDGPIHRGYTGSKMATFLATLEAPSETPVTAKVAAREWERVRGTHSFAENGIDFDAAVFDLTFAPGEMSKEFNVKVYGFETDEPAKRNPKEFELALLETSASFGKKPIGVGVLLYGA